MNSGDDDISDKFNVVLTKPIVEKKLIKTLIDLLPNQNANKIKNSRKVFIC